MGFRVESFSVKAMDVYGFFALNEIAGVADGDPPCVIEAKMGAARRRFYDLEVRNTLGDGVYIPS